MKTSLLVLFATMLATAAFAAPLPGNALAAAGAAAALNNTQPLTASSLTLTPLTQPLELTVTPAPLIVPAIGAAVAAPAPVRAVRAR